LGWIATTRCLYCESTDVPKVEIDNYSIRQLSGNYDCSDKITIKEGPDDYVIQYENGGSDKTLAANYEDFFSNALD
jgi:hypothetical protein